MLHRNRSLSDRPHRGGTHGTAQDAAAVHRVPPHEHLRGAAHHLAARRSRLLWDRIRQLQGESLFTAVVHEETKGVRENSRPRQPQDSGGGADEVPLLTGNRAVRRRLEASAAYLGERACVLSGWPVRRMLVRNSSVSHCF